MGQQREKEKIKNRVRIALEQRPQTVFDADFEGLTSNAELYIFNQEDSQE